MKKLFISCPMKGRTDEAIKESMEKMHKIAEIIFGEELEAINSFIPKDAPETRHVPVYYLGRSIQMLADADYFIGVNEYFYSGCNIERQIACEYGIPMTLIPAYQLMPDIKHCSNVETCCPENVVG